MGAVYAKASLAILIAISSTVSFEKNKMYRLEDRYFNWIQQP